MFVFLLCVLSIKSPKDNFVKDIYEGLVDEQPVNNNKPDYMLKPGEMAVPGYTDLYITSGECVYLNNPKENQVTFKYIVKLADSEEILYESKEIPGGKADQWYPTLKPGKYKVDFYIQTTRKDGKSGVTPYLPDINLEIYE